MTKGSEDSDSTRLLKLELKRADLADVIAKDPVLLASPVVKLIGPAISKGKLRRFADKAVLMQQGDSGDSLVLVVSGEVRLFARKDRDSVELGSVRGGEVLGEGEIIEGQGARRCSAVAVGQVDVIEIARDALAASSALLGLLRDVNGNRMKALDEMSDFLNRW